MFSSEWDVQLSKEEVDSVEDLAMRLVTKFSRNAISFCRGDSVIPFDERNYPKGASIRTINGITSLYDLDERGRLWDFKNKVFTLIDFCSASPFYCKMGSLKGRREFSVTTVKHLYAGDKSTITREWNFYSVGVYFEDYMPTRAVFNYCSRRSRLVVYLQRPGDESEMVDFRVSPEITEK